MVDDEWAPWMELEAVSCRIDGPAFAYVIVLLVEGKPVEVMDWWSGLREVDMARPLAWAKKCRFECVPPPPRGWRITVCEGLCDDDCDFLAMRYSDA